METAGVFIAKSNLECVCVCVLLLNWDSSHLEGPRDWGGVELDLRLACALCGSVSDCTDGTFACSWKAYNLHLEYTE